MAARRRSSYDYEWGLRSSPRSTARGIKAHSQRGKFGQTWWAERWIAAMERLVDAGRLSRGRNYARRGQVLSIEEDRQGVTARVQGSRPTPYTVKILLTPLNDAQWERVIDQMAAQAIFAAQLLAGEMPADIEQAFAAAGVSLFPDRIDDLKTSCSCPDWANPCKHVAATHYILGEQFDEDPFLLFRLRGRTQEQILQALRARRSAGNESVQQEEMTPPAAEETPPLEEAIERFWQPAERLDSFPIAMKRPVVALPLLKRLGPPSFLPDENLETLLGPAYEAITQAALAAAHKS